MYDYPWICFPGRLHSTKEVMFFLENIENLQRIISENPPHLTNLIFGDMNHPAIHNDVMKFVNKEVDRTIRKIIIEISSKKVIYHNNIPLNWYYAQRYNQVRPTMVTKVLTDEEIDSDIRRIIELCKTIFNEHIDVHIIPHLNLKSRTLNDYIPERNKLVDALETACNVHSIQFHNIGKHIETTNGGLCFIEEYMADSTHYSKGYEQVKEFLLNAIIGVAE